MLRNSGKCLEWGRIQEDHPIQAPPFGPERAIRIASRTPSQKPIKSHNHPQIPIIDTADACVALRHGGPSMRAFSILIPVFGLASAALAQTTGGDLNTLTAAAAHYVSSGMAGEHAPETLALSVLTGDNGSPASGVLMASAASSSMVA